MVDTKKFSEFLSGGDLQPNDITVGLRSGNKQFDNKLPMLPPGTTAERPAAPDPNVNWRLRFNTTDQKYEYFDNVAGAWETVESSGGGSAVLALLASHAAGEGASLVGLQNQGTISGKTVQDLANAKLIAQESNGTLVNGQFLNVLATGLVKNTTGTGVLTVIAGSSGITAIINDDTMATAAISNISNALAMKNYILNQLFPPYTPSVTVEVATTGVLSATYSNGTSGVGATLTATSNGAISIDGVTLNVSDLVLVKDQGSGDEGTNGIYTVTDTGDASNPYVLTRSAAYDEISEFVVGDAFEINAGTTNGGSEWVLTNAPTAINDNGTVANYIKYELNLAANVSGYVNLIGNENVYGVKAFQDPLIASNQLGTDYLIVGDNPEDLGGTNPALIVTIVAGDALFITQTNVDMWFAPDGGIILQAASGNDIDVTTSGGGYFNINSSQGIDEIINDDTMATATARNISTALGMKNYIDNKIAMFRFLNPVRVATTGNFASTYDNGTAGVGATLTASSNGAASIDGVSLSLTDRVLFKDQTNTFENGIYTVTTVGDGSNPAIYTRATDFDEPSEMTAGEIATVTEGTVNANTGWLLTTTVTTVGTDAITFIDFIPDITNVVTLTGTQTITGAKTFNDLTLGGDMDASSNKIINLLDPTNPQDAATKNYVDTGFVSLSGTQTVTGSKTFNAFSGTLNANLDLNGNAVTSPDGSDRIEIPNGTVDVKTDNTSRVDVTDSGVRLGGANARVNEILTDNTMSGASDTNLYTGLAIKDYIDNNLGVAATQAQMETATATNVFVSPGRQQYHPSAAKVVCYFSFTSGTPGILSSYNVSSLSDLGTGTTRLNLTVSFSDTSYSPFVSYVTPAFGLGNCFVESQATGSFSACSMSDSPPTRYDNRLAVTAFGDQ